MSHTLHANEIAHLRQAIISQCIWSDTYSSVKHILKRTANLLPLLVSFVDENEDVTTDDANDQTIFFFDRTVSNKTLFTPLQQIEDQPHQFEVYPRHCTFAITDLFKGVFELVRDGHRCGKIHTNLQKLVDFATEMKCTVVFMSRDVIHGNYPDANYSTWTSKEYSQGAIFHAQRIHHSFESSSHRSDNKYLECLDEEGYTVFLKMSERGRFSLIATSAEQQQNQPEIFLHSTQTPNIDQLIKRLTLQNNNNSDNSCIRLVRGAVPHNFRCQYLRLVRQHTHDILVGLTEEGLVTEWNLESHTPCRYATNLNDILAKFSGTWEEQTLEASVDQARTHYRENFQINMQLLSTKDWAAFFQYWKWTGDNHHKDKHGKTVPYQSRHRFHIVASIQDLSDDYESLSSAFKKSAQHHSSQSSNEVHRTKEKKILTVKQRLFLSQMSKRTSTSLNQKRERISLNNPRPTSLLISHTEKPFDNSVYDSNQNPQPSPNIQSINRSKHDSRRTQ